MFWILGLLLAAGILAAGHRDPVEPLNPTGRQPSGSVQPRGEPARSGALDQQNLAQLLSIHRIYVERFTGGETAAQMRDMIISSLQQAKLFVITENPERGDAILKGSAEDLIFTDTFQYSEGINVHTQAANSSGSSEGDSVNGVRSSAGNRRSMSAGAGIGENESSRTAERKHEATAAVRLVNKDGDVIWSTTQESLGGKFRGASADVADRIMKQLVADYGRARQLSDPGGSR